MPRSGLGCKGIRPRNTPGLIDADYQGEIVVCLYNGSPDWLTVNRMDRIAQLVFMFAIHPELHVVSEFSQTTARGTGGFGSTGKA
jgi:dUTP pyrophosphatase